MAEVTVNGQSAAEEQSTKLTEKVTTKDEIVKDANQNSETPEKLQQTLDDSTCEKSVDDMSKSNDSSDTVGIGNTVTIDDTVVIDDTVSGENNPGISDEKKEKCEPLEVNENVASVMHDGNKSGEDIDDSTKTENVVKEDSKNIADSTAVESQEGATEEAFVNVSASGMEANADSQLEGMESETKSENTDDRNTGDIKQKDEHIEQTAEQTAVLLDDEQSKDSETEDASKTTSETTVESQKQLENDSTEAEDAVQTKPEVAAEVSSSVDKTKCDTDEDSQNIHQHPANEDKDGEIPNASQEASTSTWYADEDGNQETASKPEGYSTTVIGGVVLRKPIPSSSSPELKKVSPKISRGSKFKQSLGSLFGRKKPPKAEGKQTETVVGEAQGHDGTDRVDDGNFVEKQETQEGASMDAGKDEKTMETGTVEESSQKTSNAPENGVSTPEPSQDVDKDEIQNNHDGEIVPLTEGVVKADVQVTINEPMLEEPEESPTDEDKILRERIAKRESWSPSHSPEKHMQMRVIHTEGSKDGGGKEVEVIGTREVTQRSPQSKSNIPANYRCSCHELVDVDHEGWLAKRGGAIFATWKRKWVVVKERHLYYFKTSFDPEAGGVVLLDEKHTVTTAPELKRKFAFKIDMDDAKGQKLYLAADTQEDMDKWLDVLSAASRGQVIVHKTHLQTNDNVKMRKKTNSVTKRAGSVLGIGGLYEYDGKIQKISPKPRRASIGSFPKPAEKALSLDAITSVGEEEPTIQVSTDGDPKDVRRTAVKAAVETNVKPEKEQESEQPRATSSTIEATQASKVQSAPPEEESGPPEAVGAREGAEERSGEVALSTRYEPCQGGQPTTAPLEQVPTKADHINTEEEKKSTDTMETREVSQSEETTKHVEAHVATPVSESPNSPPPRSPTNTTWYLVLDVENDAWVEYKPKDNDDELLSLVRTIKDARITITGTPLPGNEARGRAMTHVSSQNADVLKLVELRRSLKDKERDIEALDEILNEDVNRKSIHEWSTRYPCLTEEITGEVTLDNNSDSNETQQSVVVQQNTDNNVKDDEEVKKEKAEGECVENDEVTPVEKGEQRRECVENDEVTPVEKGEQGHDEERKDSDDRDNEEDVQIQDKDKAAAAEEKSNDINGEEIKEEEKNADKASKEESVLRAVNTEPEKAPETDVKSEVPENHVETVEGDISKQNEDDLDTKL